jgi:hypothetical protein
MYRSIVSAVNNHEFWGSIHQARGVEESGPLALQSGQVEAAAQPVYASFSFASPIAGVCLWSGM